MQWKRNYPHNENKKGADEIFNNESNEEDECKMELDDLNSKNEEEEEDD